MRIGIQVYEGGMLMSGQRSAQGMRDQPTLAPVLSTQAQQGSQVPLISFVLDLE